MQGAPDGLIHDTQVFGAGDIGSMATGEIEAKIASEKQGKKGDKARCQPEVARMWHGVRGWIEIEPISPYS